MNQSLISLIAVASPVIFALTALVSWFERGLRPSTVKKMAVVSTWISIVIAAISGFFVFEYGMLETSFIDIEGLGLSLRFDSVSTLMFGMIALIGFIVVRFSLNYLDGDERQGAFIGRLAATMASVQLLVLSGNLAILFLSWVLTSMSLHRLLVFYKERPGAIISARKKFILARLGDACLLAATVLLYTLYGTGNLESIFDSLQTAIASGQTPEGIETVAGLLAGAALLKSAQFPTHGWLIEVMETPTPVSALLHAGLLNAGPFLIIRMAYVMDASTYASMVLIGIGGFTALFASVVFLTQTSVKTALAYSSIAHMGFSLMTCGLGAYAAAMLHLVAHSFYKAHSFLSSGSVIDTIRSAKVKSAKRIGSPVRIALGILLGLGVYTGFAILWGIDPIKERSLLIIGGIIALGLSRLFTSALDSNGSMKLILRASFLSLVVTTAFFTLESGMHFILANELPVLAIPGTPETILMGGILLIFTGTVFIQIIAPLISTSPFTRAWAIHLRNGLYVNTVFDRTVRSLYSHGTERKPQVIESLEQINHQQVEIKKPLVETV
ncbi:proton-conducting transporter membrane subunit [Cryomorphaceae bacterium 1068]|nr:proton-conducting transporter membrane subunit [Cryomorphaceae bacterium 1068]